MRRAAIFTVLLCCAASTITQAADGCFTVHGRLQVVNGTPSVRIWRIGTNQILAIPDGPEGRELDNLPQNVRRLFHDPFLWTQVFGDYDVCPLTKAKPGVMQTVRLVRAHVTVVRNLK